MPSECPVCLGQGWIEEPRCCGRPRVMWHVDRHGDPQMDHEECCGSPECEQVQCPNCDGTGKIPLEMATS